MGSSHKTKFVKDRLNFLESAGLYRNLKTVVPRGPTAIVDGKEVINLSSNDYLGLSRNRRVIEKTVASMHEISQCSSRLISGNHPNFTELEHMLASHRETESVLVYPTGYSANLGVLMSIADEMSTIYSDELNHASIVDACRLTDASVVVFRHNDIDHLEELIAQSTKRKIIITEGVFSMDGDIGRLSEIQTIADRHDAITVIDDAHGDFIFGPTFSGTLSELGANFDIHVSSMSKALGCFGGYVATTLPIRELLVNTSRQFIYTSALPEHLCSAAIAAIPIAKTGRLQRRLRNNTAYFSSALKKLGFEIGNPSSQIIPLIIGNELEAVKFAAGLLNEGVFTQAIRYPTVSKGKARLRISISAIHKQEHLDCAAELFERVGKKLGMLS